MRLTLAQIERAVENLQPSPVTVLVRYQDGSSDRLTVEEYLNSEADLVAVHGTNIADVEKVLDRYVGFRTVID